MTKGWIWESFERVAAERGASRAVAHGESQIGFADLKAKSEAFAATLELDKGDRVLVSAPNSIGFVIAVLAIWRRDAIPVIIHHLASDTHKAHCLATTAARLVLTQTGDFPGTAAMAIPAPAEIAQGSYRSLPPCAAVGDDPASIIFTSGSTGPPKGVVQLSATLVGCAHSIGGLLGLTEADSILCSIPFAFDYGWGQLMSLVVRGVPLVLPEPANGFGLCAAMADHRPTVFASVPAVMGDLFAGLAPIADTPKESIRLITNTGSRLPDLVFDRICEHFPDAEISLNYGLTETYRSASLPTGQARTHRASVGYAVPGVELRIMTEDGSEAAPGEPGEVVHIGAGVFHGYWNEPEKTDRVKINWPEADGTVRSAVRTGDIGYKDADGRLFIKGRRDRQIKCMGVRISLEEIEVELAKCPHVREAAVVAIDHDVFGAFIVAFIRPSQTDFDEKAVKRDVMQYARATLSPYMQPRLIRIIASLPRNTNTKVDYPALQKLTAGS